MIHSFFNQQELWLEEFDDSGTHVIEAIAALERMLQTHSVQECQVLLLHNPEAQ